MKADPNAARAFATLRFAGDRLDPGQITEALHARPTLAYRKGEPYPIGSGRKRIGKTGLWIFSTDGLFPPHEVSTHLAAIAGLIAGDPKRPTADKKFRLIRQIVEEQSLSPVVTIFWHGPHGATPPVIRSTFRNLITMIHGEVEEDFDVDGGEPSERLLASA